MQPRNQDNGIIKSETRNPSVNPTPIFNSPNERAEYVVRFFEQGLAPALEHISPVLSQVFKDFAHLRKGRGETIMGCKTQEEWSRKYFQRSANAVRFWCLPEEEKESRRITDRNRKQRNRLNAPPASPPAPSSPEVQVKKIPPMTAEEAIAPIVEEVQEKLAEKQIGEELNARLQRDDDFAPVESDSNVTITKARYEELLKRESELQRTQSKPASVTQDSKITDDLLRQLWEEIYTSLPPEDQTQWRFVGKSLAEQIQGIKKVNANYRGRN